MSKYAMILQDYVIDIVDADTAPSYPPDADGNEVTAVKCDNKVILGMVYDSKTKTFTLPAYEPIEEQLSDIDAATLDTAVNVDYLVCLKDMGL